MFAAQKVMEVGMVKKKKYYKEKENKDLMR